MKKAQLREQFIELRRDMSPRQVEESSADVLRTLGSAIGWKDVRRAHIYKSVEDWNEVRTDAIIRYITDHWPRVSLVIGDPVRSAAPPAEIFDVIFVPLLAFDEDCNRLGFGGGWYDRFLAAQPDALKVGLAYGLQRTDSIPVDDHDIPMDMIVTNSGIFTR